MAKNKKSFLLYCDLIHTVEKMPPEKAGELFLHILKYVNDQNPASEDLIVNLTFEPIKQQLKRDLVKWDSITEKRKEAGAKGGKQTQANARNAKANQADSVTDTVNDKDNDTVKERVLKKHTKTHTEVLEGYFFDLNNGSDIERISMDLKTPLERIKSLLSDFRASSELSYPTYAKFVFHFKNWARKNLAKKPNKTVKLLTAYEEARKNMGL